MSDIAVRHNPDASRFESDTPDGLALAQYRRARGGVAFTHTEVPESQEGQGIGEALAEAALDWAKAEGLPVYPYCPFIAAFIERHDRYASLVAADFSA